jgi:hypothetical protein
MNWWRSGSSASAVMTRLALAAAARVGRARHRKHTVQRGVLCLGALSLAILGGCGPGGASSARGTPTAPPTATVPPLPVITPDAQVASACSGPAGARLSIAQVRVGEFDGWQELPSALPLSPQPVATAKVIGNLALKTVTVDVLLQGGAQASPGYLCAVTVAVASYQPLSAPIPNVIRTCSDHPYLDPGGADYGGDCGVLPGPPATAAVTLPTSSAGTAVTVPVVSVENPGKPASFPSAGGQAPHVWIALSVPISGAYTVVVGLWQDNTGPAARVAVSERFNLDAKHEWSGQYCTTPDMQAQLPPPTNPPTPLLCPGPPPSSAYS